jgi:hypothetical protein
MILAAAETYLAAPSHANRSAGALRSVAMIDPPPLSAIVELSCCRQSPIPGIRKLPAQTVRTL